METVQDSLFGLGKSEGQHTADVLFGLGMIDLGRIAYYNNKTGMAEVEGYSFVGQTRVMYKDVEVLQVGGVAGCFKNSIIGAPCILFFPRAIVPDLHSPVIDRFAPAYDKSGVKCIALSGVRETDYSMGFDSDGSFKIMSEGYTVVIDANGVSYMNNDGSIFKGLSPEGESGSAEGAGNIIMQGNSEDGSYEIRYWNLGMTKLLYRMKYGADGSYTVQRVSQEDFTKEQLDDMDSYIDYVWTDKWDSAGNRTRELRSASGTDGTDAQVIQTLAEGVDGSEAWTLTDADGNTLLDVQVAATGGFTITQSNADGDVLNKVEVTDTGDVTIAQTKAENTITLKQDGTLEINTKGAINITGNDAVNIHAEGALTVDSTDAASFMAGSGKKVKVGNASTTLKKILIDDLLNNLLANFDTAGSPAAHKTGPGATSTIQTLAQQWGQVLE